MASVSSTLSAPCCSLRSTCTSSSSAILQPKNSNFRLSPLFPQLGVTRFSPWNGLRHLGISIRQKSLNLEKKGRSKGKVVYDSLFGVGAPEALVIGVVALLVFGPKGLAEVARNLGKTLRAFQPTIRELQDVSREFKSTLEREIGLDDIQRPTQSSYGSKYTKTTSTPSPFPSNEDPQAVLDPNGSPPNRAYSSEDYLKITEEQLKASALKQQDQPTPAPAEPQLPSSTEKQLETQTSQGAAMQDAVSQVQKPESNA